MIKLSYVMVGLVVLMAACQKPEKVTPSGLKYTVVKAGDGVPAKKGEIIIFHFQLKDNKDSIWNESYRDGLPSAIEVRDSAELKQQDGITQMLSALTKGDSVKTTMTTKEFFKTLVKQPVPPTVDSTGSLTYTIKAVNVSNFDDFIKWRTAATKTRDDKQIKKYLADNKITAQQDTSGIYYVIHKATGGAKPTPENCVEVRYEGKFLKTSQRFDANERIGFSLNEVIPGWRLSIPMLAKGDSGTFFIPSNLAYGPQGYPGSIPPDAILMFDVKLLDFNNQVDPATRRCKP
jgi:FKBP-type peptidyl-prolyl cis-trans isomerase FkpA